MKHYVATETVQTVNHVLQMVQMQNYTVFYNVFNMKLAITAEIVAHFAITT